jgi:hypothetical protein
MLNNLVQYLINQSLDLVFVADALTEQSPKECVLVSQSGGTPAHFHQRTDWTVQILSRAETSIVAKRACERVYDVLKNKFCLVLPAVTVDKVAYPAVTAYQVSPIQAPAGIGADQANLFMWVFNTMITTT